MLLETVVACVVFVLPSTKQYDSMTQGECGHTRKTTGGPPMRAMAVESLRMLPPL